MTYENLKVADHSEDNINMVEQERNFCPRCGKRASKDLEHIHTCTPPSDSAASEAVASGDGTLHGAIDYWQKRALEAEAKLVSNSLESGDIKTTWQPIAKAPKDNKRPLYLAFLINGQLNRIWVDGGVSDGCNGWFSADGGFVEPTHWAYQDEPIPKVPIGWKLVPVEPTEQMIQNTDVYLDELDGYLKFYKAMLNAAPHPPRQEFEAGHSKALQ